MARTLLLLYEKNHLKQPFIKMLLASLQDDYPGHRIVMASFATKKQVDPQQVGDFVQYGRWNQTKEASLRLAARAYGSGRLSLRLIRNGLEILEKFDPKVIVTFLPLSFLTAQIWKRRKKRQDENHFCRVVYYPFEIYGEQRSRSSRMVILAETIAFLLRPDAFITQNEERARYYEHHRLCRTPAFIARNYKTRPQLDTHPSRVFDQYGTNGRKVVLYQGMLSEGRWLDRLVLSARYLKEDAILVLMGPKQMLWWKDRIEPLLQHPEVSGRVLVLDQVPHEDVFAYATNASVGIIIYDDSVVNNLYCAPGKLGDFVHAGVPVVAPGFPSIRSVIERDGLGLTFDDYSPQGIGATVNRLLALPRENFRSSLATASQYMTWEAQWPSMRKAIIGDTLEKLLQRSADTSDSEKDP